MSYIYGATCKARNFIYMDLGMATLKAISFYLLHSVSTLNQCRKFLVSQLCVNTLPATKFALILDGSLRAKVRQSHMWVPLVLSVVSHFMMCNREVIVTHRNFLMIFKSKLLSYVICRRDPSH
jgi:hypothetical protein